MLVIQSNQTFGDVRCVHANQITLTAIPPDERDESGFVIDVPLIKPSNIEDNVPVYERFYGKMPCANVITYARAIMPDWVDIGEEVSEQEPDPYPSVDEVEIEFEDMGLTGHCYNRYIDIPLETKVIGKHGKAIFQSYEMFVEYCDNTNAILQDSQVFSLDPTAVAVTYDSDISVEGGTGSGSGSGNVVKTISVVANKNNFLDLYIDLDGIVSISNLPVGLSYKNKHISGIPVKSGVYSATVNFDPNITDATSYTIRFTIPALERIV